MICSNPGSNYLWVSWQCKQQSLTPIWTCVLALKCILHSAHTFCKWSANEEVVFRLLSSERSYVREEGGKRRSQCVFVEQPVHPGIPHVFRPKEPYLYNVRKKIRDFGPLPPLVNNGIHVALLFLSAFCRLPSLTQCGRYLDMAPNNNCVFFGLDARLHFLIHNRKMCEQNVSASRIVTPMLTGCFGFLYLE